MKTIKLAYERSTKSSDELVQEYLANGGAVTQCKNFNPSSNVRPKRAKNKAFVSDAEFQTGKRKGSVI